MDMSHVQYKKTAIDEIPLRKEKVEKAKLLKVFYFLVIRTKIHDMTAFQTPSEENSSLSCKQE